MKRVIFFLLSALSFGYYLWIGLNNDFGLSLLPFWLLLALLFLVLGLVGTPPLPNRLRRWLRAGLAVLLVLFLTVEGFILGFLGALIAFFLQWGLYDFVAMKVAEIDSLQLITVAPFLDVIEPVALIYALTGFVVGVFGSLLSIRKFLKV